MRIKIVFFYLLIMIMTHPILGSENYGGYNDDRAWAVLALIVVLAVLVVKLIVGVFNAIGKGISKTADAGRNLMTSTASTADAISDNIKHKRDERNFREEVIKEVARQQVKHAAREFDSEEKSNHSAINTEKLEADLQEAINNGDIDEIERLTSLLERIKNLKLKL